MNNKSKKSEKQFFHKIQKRGDVYHDSNLEVLSEEALSEVSAGVSGGSCVHCGVNSVGTYYANSAWTGYVW